MSVGLELFIVKSRVTIPRSLKQIRNNEGAFHETCTNPFMSLMGAFVQAPFFISFFFAIRNVAENVPSYKEGGALWFTDLTIADPDFILPIMSGAFTLATIELGAMDGMQGQPMIGKMKMFLEDLQSSLFL